MRGEICVGFASSLSIIAVALLIAAHVSQLNTNIRSLFLVQVDVSNYGTALETALFDPTVGLYTSNPSAPLLVGAGLRQFYKFGLYSHCAYVDSKNGICTNHTFAAMFRPFDAITSDMQANYSAISAAIMSGTTFTDSGYLGESTRAAFWLVFIGTLGAALAFLVGLAKHSYTFLFSAILSALSSLLVLISAAIWTVMIKKAQDINTVIIGTTANQTALGITVSVGKSLYLIWAAFACLLISVLPYMISCCTFRG
ncbi:actin cortical patch SUR7/pH-response regulator pali [Mycena floridula]|nr:actin cortical patch SUR7/pH-response regulator pali [Mycena floridula]